MESDEGSPLFCCICFESYSTAAPHRPLASSCGHSHCESCFQQLKEKRCPICRSLLNPKFVPHLDMLNLLHLHQQLAKRKLSNLDENEMSKEINQWYQEERRLALEARDKHHLQHVEAVRAAERAAATEAMQNVAWRHKEHLRKIDEQHAETIVTYQQRCEEKETLIQSQNKYIAELNLQQTILRDQLDELKAQIVCYEQEKQERLRNLPGELLQSMERCYYDFLAYANKLIVPKLHVPNRREWFVIRHSQFVFYGCCIKVDLCQSIELFCNDMVAELDSVFQIKRVSSKLMDVVFVLSSRNSKGKEEEPRPEKEKNTFSNAEDAYECFIRAMQPYCSILPDIEDCAIDENGLLECPLDMVKCVQITGGTLKRSAIEKLMCNQMPDMQWSLRVDPIQRIVWICIPTMEKENKL